MKTNLSRIALVLLFFVQLLTSCDPVGDKSRQVLQNAIDELARQPGRWGDTLNGAMTKLDEIGTKLAKNIVKDVKSLYDHSVQTTQAAAFCGADFIGIRVKQNMQGILHDYFPDSPAPSYTPIVCTVEPTVIQSDGEKQISFSGFDFLNFEKPKYSADLVYGDTEEIVPNYGVVSVETNYLTIVDLQSRNLSELDGSRSPQLVLHWENEMVDGNKSEVPINIVPPPTPTPMLYDYKVELTTDCWNEARGAAKGAIVRITLIGSKGKTTEAEVTGPFSQCATASKIIYSQQDIGVIQSVHIIYDSKGSSDGWMLSSVSVSNLTLDPTTRIWGVWCLKWFGRHDPYEAIYPDPNNPNCG